MEKLLRDLFDYQKFEQNQHLDKVIKELNYQEVYELSNDELEYVAAAGAIEERAHR